MRAPAAASATAARFPPRTPALSSSTLVPSSAASATAARFPLVRRVLRSAAPKAAAYLFSGRDIHRRHYQRRHNRRQHRHRRRRQHCNGAIIDSGTIKAANVGILVNSGGVIFSGIQVSSKGTISASSGSGVAVQNTTTFGGGITNSGTISTGRAGIGLSACSTFVGGITNSGVIFGGSVLVFADSSFAGGVTNSGKITGDFRGIRVNSVGAFAGGIDNSKTGTIAAKSFDGIVVGGSATSGTPVTVLTFAGGITNSGRITAGSSGIDLASIETITGGVTNTGAISAALVGVDVGINVGFGGVGVATFIGDVVNSGTISAGHTGLRVVSVGVFSGGIVDSGTILAGSDGILVNNSGVISGGIQVSSKGTISAEKAASWWRTRRRLPEASRTAARSPRSRTVSWSATSRCSASAARGWHYQHRRHLGQQRRNRGFHQRWQLFRRHQQQRHTHCRGGRHFRPQRRRLRQYRRRRWYRQQRHDLG